MAEEKEEKKKDKPRETLVVNQLPTQQIRTADLNEKTYDLLTTDEALTEILEHVRAVRKAVA